MTKRRALVAEDSLFILMALEINLKSHHIEVIGPASTLAEAQTLAERGGFEIAILDINLHGEKIFPVANLLKQRDIPIIFTSGYSANEVMPRCLMTVPLIQKPYDHEALIALIERAFVEGENRIIKAGTQTGPVK